MKRPTSYWLLLLALLTSPALTQAQTTRFVSTTGTNANPATATSWATSTTNLQGAINASVAGDQVWVRSGLFRPTTTTGPNITPATVGTTDLAGNPRFINTLIGMGTYELQSITEIISLKDGSWNDPTLWSVGRLPLAGGCAWGSNRWTESQIIAYFICCG